MNTNYPILKSINTSLIIRYKRLPISGGKINKLDNTYYAGMDNLRLSVWLINLENVVFLYDYIDA